MIAMLVLAAVALGLMVATLVELWRDRPRAIPRSRAVDPDSLPPRDRWLSA